MTAPIRPLVLSLDGRSARELYAIERTNDNGEPTNPPATGGFPPDVDLAIAHPGSVKTLTAQPSGETLYWPGTPWFDTRAFNQMRVVLDAVETAGHTTARVIAKYATADGGTFLTPGAASAEVAASIATTGAKRSTDWVALDPGAVGDRVWRASAIGGNGTLTPVVGGVHFQFRTATIAPPAVPPGDLPEGGAWGNIVFDANAVAEDMQAAYNEGDDVDTFTDQIAGNNLTTAEVLLRPTYRTAAFNGSRPCVEWTGANVPLTAPANPTQPYGDWTYYLLIEALDGGGDGSFVWGDPGNGSFVFRINASNTLIAATCNNTGGALTNITDTWGMSGAHIYRFVKDAGLSKWYMFVDGVKVAEVANAPQTNDTASVVLMDFVTGLGVSGKIGRIVGYDTSHLSPTNGGGVSDGLTLPELVLQAYWGTP